MSITILIILIALLLWTLLPEPETGSQLIEERRRRR